MGNCFPVRWTNKNKSSDGQSKRRSGRRGGGGAIFACNEKATASVALEMTGRRLSKDDTNAAAAEAVEDRNHGRKKETPAPSLVSRLFMFWILNFLWRGVFTHLEGKDMPRLRNELSAGQTTRRAFRLWDEMMSAEKEQRSVFRMIWILNKGRIAVGCLFGVAQGILNNAARPLLLNYLILSYAEDWSVNYVMLLLFGLGTVVLLEGFCKVVSQNWLHTDMGTATLAWLIPLIQRKATRIDITASFSPSSSVELETDRGRQKEEKAGDGMSSEDGIIGVDCIRSFEIARYVMEIPSHIVGLMSGIIALIFLLGKPALVGLFTMGCAIALNRYAAIQSKPVAAKDLEAADRRLGTMSEVIETIAQVKFMVWEQQYKDLLRELREEECKWILLYRILICISLTVGRASPVLASCATFTYMGLSSEYELEPNTIFSALAAYNALRLPLIALPLEFVVASTVRVSHDRIVKYLSLPETGPRRDKRPAPSASSSSADVVPLERVVVVENEEGSTKSMETAAVAKRTDDVGADETIVAIKDADFSWSAIGSSASVASDFKAVVAGETIGESSGSRAKTEVAASTSLCLRQINMVVKRGELVAIVGRVGSGKSSLLSSILGATKRVRGTLCVVRSRASDALGYCGQTPFIFSGTVLSNILVGRALDKNALASAIAASALDTDLTLMSDGLDTQIGERGVTLSGGQRMRVAIARAIYMDPSLLILDDPLAAVDGKVAKAIFKRVCRFRRRRGLTTIVALNQLDFAKRCDRTFHVDDGKIVKISDAVSIDKDEDDDDGVVATKKYIVADDVRDTKGEREEEDKKGDIGSGGLAKKEKRRIGGLDVATFAYFLKRAGGFRFGIVVCSLGFAAYGLMATTDMWLASWVQNDDQFGRQYSDTERAIGYVAFSLGQALLVLSLSTWDAFSVNEACKAIHADSIERLLAAPSSFFETTPSGRITSRFSSDLSLVDHNFADTLDNFIQFTFIMAALIAVIVVIVPEMSAVFVIGLGVYGLSVFAVNRSNREAKRETNSAQSPLLTTYAETVTGRVLIRTMGFERFFLRRQLTNVDVWNRYNHFSCSTVVWGSLLTALLGFFFAMSAASLVYVNVRYNGFDDVSLIGVALNYTFVLPYFLGIYSIFCLSMTYAFTSLERIAEYTSEEMPKEPEWRLTTDPSPTEWPRTGDLTFKGVSMRYRPELPEVLKGIDFLVKGGERVGVVGRTGAGKSSLVGLLFRLRDASAGSVVIDGRKTTAVGLHCLRDAIAILPQVPAVFRDRTIAYNLDPFESAEHEDIARCLRRVGLIRDDNNEDDAALAKANEGSSKVSARSPESKASDLSVGELQLLALARLLLVREKVKLMVLDEPTSSIDLRTDRYIQRIIEEDFKGVTTLTIAHRIDTIIDYDKILVLDAGHVVEFGHPGHLLSPDFASGRGHFASMVDALDAPVARNLRASALAKWRAARSEREGPSASKKED